MRLDRSQNGNIHNNVAVLSLVVLMETCSKNITDYVMCLGDFNIDCLKLKDAATVYLNNRLDSLGLFQLIDELTRGVFR